MTYHPAASGRPAEPHVEPRAQSSAPLATYDCKPPSISTIETNVADDNGAQLISRDGPKRLPGNLSAENTRLDAYVATIDHEKIRYGASPNRGSLTDFVRVLISASFCIVRVAVVPNRCIW